MMTSTTRSAHPDAAGSAAASPSADAPLQSNTLAGIDLSSWLSWVSYGIGFALAIKLAPAMVDDVLKGGLGAGLLAGTVVAFFAAILVIQRHMSISLRNTSFGQPQKLVDGGIFAYSRNPMYLAFLMPIAALAYYSPPAALAAGAIYVLSMNRWVISVEEQILAASFGDSFRRYCQATPRWLFW